MSNKLPQEDKTEEIDLGQLFNAVSKLFEKLFSFISKIFNDLFKRLIYTLKPLVNNFKIIAVILMVFAIIGYVMERFQKPIYVSDMLVRPYFESKYQLANNIDYFNALIREKKHDELSKIFEIDAEKCSDLAGFKIDIGPQTKNELLQEYDEFLKSIDSTLAKDVTFDDFVENRDILDGTTFIITAKSKKQSIFKSLENGIIKTFENEYSKKNKKIQDSSLHIKRQKLLKDLKRVDSIQKIYLEVVVKDSEREKITLSPGLIPVTQEQRQTKEYELLKEEIEIRNKLSVLDEQQIVESDFYDILSSFEEVGTREKNLLEKYSMVLPAIVFVLLIMIFILFKAFNYIKQYE